MAEVSRRVFFKRAGAAAAVAAVGTSIAVGTTDIAGAATRGGAHPEAAISPQDDLRAGEYLVARVKNARTGEINLFIGQKEVTIHDRKVAARLIRATRKEN
jgi:hypothetical protein